MKKNTASSHSTSSQSHLHTNSKTQQNHNQQDEVYSSSETILNSDDAEQLSLAMADQQNNGSPHKSLKINVMRDLKCAAKIKSAYKSSDQQGYTAQDHRKNSIHNLLPEPVNFNEDRPHDSGLMRRQSIGTKSPAAVELPISKIKRSQTFSQSTTLPRNYGTGKVRQSVMNIEQGSWSRGDESEDLDDSFYAENKSTAVTHQVNSYEQGI